MIQISSTSRQPQRDAWSFERLVNECSISLGYSLDTSSFGTYTSALNSYPTFCNLHHLPVDPSPDTLSFYVVFLSSHIKPDSVNSYLSGICQQLEPFFPEIRQNRKSILVTRSAHYDWVYEEVWYSHLTQGTSFVCKSSFYPG
jgi:hypothetical protein